MVKLLKKHFETVDLVFPNLAKALKAIKKHDYNAEHVKDLVDGKHVDALTEELSDLDFFSEVEVRLRDEKMESARLSKELKQGESVLQLVRDIFINNTVLDEQEWGKHKRENGTLLDLEGLKELISSSRLKAEVTVHTNERPGNRMAKNNSSVNASRQPSGESKSNTQEK